MTVGGFPFSFIGQNFGMQCMTKSLINIRRQLQSHQEVDVTDLLSFANTVLKSIQTVCNQELIKLKNILHS